MKKFRNGGKLTGKNMKTILTRTKLDLNDLLEKIRKQRSDLSKQFTTTNQNNNENIDNHHHHLELNAKPSIRLFQKPWLKRKNVQSQRENQPSKQQMTDFYYERYTDSDFTRQDDVDQNCLYDINDEKNSLFYQNLNEYPDYCGQTSRYIPYLSVIPFYTQYSNHELNRLITVGPSIQLQSSKSKDRKKKVSKKKSTSHRISNDDSSLMEDNDNPSLRLNLDNNDINSININMDNENMPKTFQRESLIIMNNDDVNNEDDDSNSNQKIRMPEKYSILDN
ncbi:hypothetical protein DERF_005099 [Dermatophagoides farinae]|uniref:Uncharacterized protein n=1 Tax=Dermatophagoides farinae TaxID=6954 RepID=A0A922L6T9_DERFA|nr:hypothetical protein DERF_005099 [Dermatophagoides farinae]